MRVSSRKVVKYSTFLVIIFTLNIWVSYNVNLWSFRSAQEFEKVEKSLGFDDNGGQGGFHFDNNNVNLKGPFETLSSLRNQRSAKSFISSESSSVAEIKTNVSVPAKNGKDASVQQVAVEGPSVETRQPPGRARKITNVQRKEQGSFKLPGVDDIFLSVKTTLKYHESRVKLLLRTWYGLAPEQTYFFTDGHDQDLSESLNGHLINTNCSTDHSRRALSCKMAVEFDHYMASRKHWFCHVDDDVYVNVPQLVELLSSYNHKEDWYLGKPSLTHPLEVADRQNPGMRLTFWFATGGAGFCISRSLALKMAPYTSGGRFMTTAESIRLPDDCTLGYIIEYLLRQKLTIIPTFHSHLENLNLIKKHMLRKQITFSFSHYSGRRNAISVPGFSLQEDPTRFRSIHCFLFPKLEDCLELLETSIYSQNGQHSVS